MAISLNEQTSAGKILATDTVAGTEMEIVKINVGAAGADSLLSSANPLPVQIVTGTAHAGSFSLTGSASVFISGGAILASITGTVNVAVLSMAGSYLAAGALTQLDYDTGVGTINMPMVGIALPSSGTVLAGGTATNPFNVVVGDGTAHIGSFSLTGSASVFVSGGAIQASITGSMSVFISSMPAVVLGNGTANIGTVSLSGSVSALVQGMAAHGAGVSGNPLLLGGEGRTTRPTAVSDGQTVRLQADDLGRLVVVVQAPRDYVGTPTAFSLSVSTTSTLLAAGAANIFNDITLLVLSNQTAANAIVQIYDALNAGNLVGTFMLAQNGGGVVIPCSPPLKQGTAATAWGIKTDGAGGISGSVAFVQNI